MKKNVLFLALLASALQAQEITDTIQVREVMLSENRLNTPLSKQNRNIYVIDKQEIQKLPVKSVQDILQYANGIDLRQRGPAGTQADFSMDGGSFEQTLLLVNGVKIIDHQTAHNALNLPIPVEAIERVEIIRGPAARIYGNNSLTGVINIVTKKNPATGFYVNTYTGSNFEKDSEESGDTFWSRGVQLGGVIGKEKHNHQLYLSHDKGNGYRYNTAFENNKVYYQGHFQIDAHNEIDASFGYVKNGFGSNGFYAAPGDKDSKELVETTLATLQSKHQINDRLTLIPRLSYRYNFDDYRYFKNNLNAARSLHYSNAVSGELNSVYQLNKGQIGVGVEYRNEQISSTSIKQHTRDNVGVYAEYKTQFGERVDVNVGTYLNYNSQYGWQAFPGIDASYAVTDEVKLVANAGSSQRIPSFTDLYLDQRPGNIGNASIESEQAFQTEVGMKFSRRAFSVNAYYFYRKINDFIDWVRLTSNEPWQSQNFGDMKTNGFNIQTNYRLKLDNEQQLDFGLSYAFLDQKFLNVNSDFLSKYKIESLKHQINNTLSYQYKKSSLTFVTRYNERESYKSYWINDIRLSHTLNKLTVYIDGQNIFNTKYNEVGAIPLPSKWWSVGVKFVNF